MKRQVLRLAGAAALAAGGVTAPAAVAHADPGASNGNRFTYVYHRSTVVCGNSIAIEAVVRNHCRGGAGTYDADLDQLDGIHHLDLDFTGDSADDEAGRWFPIGSNIPG